MDLNPTFVITGANGTVGAATAAILREAGAGVKALVRDLSKARPLLEMGCRVVLHDLDRDVPADLFEDADGAFLITGESPTAADQARRLVAAARPTRTPIVRLSAAKASPDAPTASGRLHHSAEKAVKASGDPYTILRSHFQFQNATQAMPSIQTDGKIRHGMGHGRLGMVDARDVAACAATRLLDGHHTGTTYTLTGPESLGWSDVAKALARALGSKVQYIPVPLEPVWHGSLDMGRSEWQAQVDVDYAQAYKDGWGDFVTNDVQAILGRPPRSVHDFCDEVIGPLLQPMV